MSVTAQRPRWADLVDSSDDEMMSTAGTALDIAMPTDMEIVKGEASTMPTGRSRKTRSPCSRRRSVKMPMFSKPFVAPTMCKASQSAVRLPGRVPKSSPNACVQQPISIGCCSEDGWEKRFGKRCAAIQIVKAMPEYRGRNARGHGQGRSGSTPRTPDPFDQTISKRRWEAEVAMWRSATRQRFESL
jgi:hypothetical protein